MNQFDSMLNLYLESELRGTLGKDERGVVDVLNMERVGVRVGGLDLEIHEPI